MSLFTCAPFIFSSASCFFPCCRCPELEELRPFHKQVDGCAYVRIVHLCAATHRSLNSLQTQFVRLGSFCVCASSIFVYSFAFRLASYGGILTLVLPGGGRRKKLSSPLSPFFESSCQVSAGRPFCSTLLTWARISSPSAPATTRSIFFFKISRPRGYRR